MVSILFAQNLDELAAACEDCSQDFCEGLDLTPYGYSSNCEYWENGVCSWGEPWETGDCETEICGDGMDNTGDGVVDGGCPENAVGNLDAIEDCEHDCSAHIFCEGVYSCPIVQGNGYCAPGEPDTSPDCSGSITYPPQWWGGAEICNNANDDDGDGLVGCMDPDCAGKVGYNLFNENYGMCEWRMETICDDGFDNNANTIIDCADPNCQLISPYCTATEICDDGIDNTGDGMIDCDSPQCWTDPACCGDGICKWQEVCPIDCTPEPFCSDGVDNDGNGSIDCSDPACKTVYPCSVTAFDCPEGNCSLSLIDRTQHGGTVASSSPLYQWLKDWKLLTVILLILSVGFVSAVYMIAKNFQNTQLTAWAMQEMGQVILSAVIFVVILAALFIVDVIADQIIEDLFGTQYKFETDTSKPFALAQYYINDLMDMIKIKTVEITKDNYEIGKEMTKREGINYQSWPYISYSWSPNADNAMPFQRNNFIVTTYAGLMGALGVQKALLEGIAWVVGPILLMVGIILRSFILTRKAGGTLIAAGIGLLIIYPLTYALALYTLGVSAQGNKIIAPLDPNCPTECLKSPPLAYNRTTLEIYNKPSDLIDYIPVGHFWDDDYSKSFLDTYYNVTFCDDVCGNCSVDCRELPIKNCNCDITNCTGENGGTACPQVCMVVKERTCDNRFSLDPRDYCSPSLCPEDCKKDLEDTLEISNYDTCQDCPWHCRYKLINGWDVSNDPACQDVNCSSCNAKYEMPSKAGWIMFDCENVCTCETYCRVMNPGPSTTCDDCGTECNPNNCFVDFDQNKWHATCDAWFDETGSSYCPTECRFVDKADRAPWCFEGDTFINCENMPDYCKVGTVKNRACDGCFDCAQDCTYKNPVRTDCNDVCIPPAESRTSMSLENILEDMTDQGAVGRTDVKIAGVLMIPAYILPLFNIVLCLAFIRQISKYIGGDHELPGIEKLV